MLLFSLSSEASSLPMTRTHEAPITTLWQKSNNVDGDDGQSRDLGIPVDICHCAVVCHGALEGLILLLVGVIQAGNGSHV